MLARKLKYYGYRIAPRPAAAVHRYLQRGVRAWRVRRAKGGPGPYVAGPSDELAQAKALADRCRDVNDVERIVDLTFRYGGVASNQNRGEIIGLLAMLRESQPRLLCEIGSAAGGTLFLLSQVAHPEARILSLDINNDAARAERFRALVRPSQELTCLQGDSHEQKVYRQFRSWIGDERLDFLLIDGDHTFEGVACDHRMYGPYVRPGGMIAFHDIVPDYQTRYGVDTGTFAGGVPEFWEQLEPGGARVSEFVDHRLQDGRGIGVVEVPADPDRGRGP